MKRLYHLLQRLTPDRVQALRAFLYRLRDWRNGRARTPFLKIRPAVLREPALLVDVSEVTVTHAATGIQRVTRHVLAELRRRETVIPVRNVCGHLVTACQYDCFEAHVPFDGNEERVEFLPGDRLFLLDASWLQVGDFQVIVREAERCGVPVYGMVHDIFPILHPTWFASHVFVRSFIDWHQMLCRSATTIFCVSQTTAQDLGACASAWQLPLPHFVVTYVGVDLEKREGHPRQRLRAFMEGRQTFLMVGTVEERKEQAFVCSAMRPLLATGTRLLLLGHAGKGAEALRHLLRTDEVLQENVLWLEDATDEELAWAYGHAEALLMASRAEGFGLPLIEAAKYGCPIICTDLPIFREVTAGAVTYFPVGDGEALRTILRAWRGAEDHPRMRLPLSYTWQAVADKIDQAMRK